MRPCKSDGALGRDPLLEVLGGLHLVVTDVVPDCGGADKKKKKKKKRERERKKKSSYVVQCLNGKLRMVWS